MTFKQSIDTAVLIVVAGVGALVAGGALLARAEARTNKVALASEPRGVTTIAAQAATYRQSRSYVGTLHPWLEASVGPQLISAYVDSVLVRPGASVKRNEVLATLDCRHASSASNAIAMEARAIAAKQKALADEAGRAQQLLKKGFASANEVEQSVAQSAAQEAELEAQRATLSRSSLEVNDCVLRAPFDGEVGDRFVDPGSFVRPGTPVVSVVDRSTVRFSADVPEIDFAVVAPQTALTVHVDATGQDLDGAIARRAPHADRDTRTVRFEVDLANASRVIPTDTTGESVVPFGPTRDVTAIPLYAAAVRGGKATVFVVEGDVAHQRAFDVAGEVGATLYVTRDLPPGARVVTEGRALLHDGDRVAAKDATPAPASSGPVVR